jgi:uncharacterized protein with ATP-grasp and redox domains
MTERLLAEQACLHCMQGQADRLARLLAKHVSDPNLLKIELQALANPDKLGTSPPMIARAIYHRARELTGIEDPYRDEKAHSTRLALDLLPDMRRLIGAAEDPLQAAIQIAIAGNIIDFGPGQNFDLKAQLERALSIPVDTRVLDRMRRDLKAAQRVLYLGDNAGEAVFDRLLIEQIDAPVTFAVRGAAVINDVTEAEAIASGLNQVANILSTGSDIPGILLEECSPQFQQAFAEADVIISKGQGNYESLSGTSGPIYFLLVVKCDLVAGHLNRQVGDFAFLAANLS